MYKVHRRLFSYVDWGQLSEKALVVVGPDRLILEDTTRYGLHRMHIIRFGELPDVDGWRRSVPDGLTIYRLAFIHQGIGHLWMVWKEEV